MNEIETRWTQAAAKQLVGRKIVAVRYMTKAEQKEAWWDSRALMIELDDGNVIYPSADDEGNNAGALFTMNDAEPVLPVL